MRSWHSRGPFFAVAFCALILTGPPSGRAQEGEAMPMENLRLPVQHYEDGRVKVQIKAEKAMVPLKGIIHATRAVVEMFDEQGNVETVITADTCTFDRDKGIATSDSDVRLERADIVIAGKGFEWRADTQVVKILENARVTFNRNIYAKRQKKL
jgi:hypothetical protein